MIEPQRTKTLNRLKRLRGQIDGIIKMIEEDKYCIDIITQVLAAQGSLKAIAPMVFESHLNSCSVKKLNSKDKNVKAGFINELVKTFALSHR